MKIVASACLALALAACGGTSTVPSEKPGNPQPPPGTVELASLGAACGDDGACPAGTTCREFYGIAGGAGPKFTSCEVPCGAGEACPDGAACVTIADGPGAVCRPVEPTAPVAE